MKNRKGIQDGSFDTERALAVGWRELDSDAQGDFQRRFETLKKNWDVEKEAVTGERSTALDGEGRGGDEDVEMGDDTDKGQPNGSTGGGGFTAVNKS